MTKAWRAGALGILLVLLLSRCSWGGDDGSLQVEFYSIDGEEISQPDRRVIEGIARATVDEAGSTCHSCRRHWSSGFNPVR